MTTDPADQEVPSPINDEHVVPSPHIPTLSEATSAIHHGIEQLQLLAQTTTHALVHHDGDSGSVHSVHLPGASGGGEGVDGSTYEEAYVGLIDRVLTIVNNAIDATVMLTKVVAASIVLVSTSSVIYYGLYVLLQPGPAIEMDLFFHQACGGDGVSSGQQMGAANPNCPFVAKGGFRDVHHGWVGMGRDEGVPKGKQIKIVRRTDNKKEAKGDGEIFDSNFHWVGNNVPERKDGRVLKGGKHYWMEVEFYLPESEAGKCLHIETAILGHPDSAEGAGEDDEVVNGVSKRVRCYPYRSSLVRVLRKVTMLPLLVADILHEGENVNVEVFDWFKEGRGRWKTEGVKVTVEGGAVVERGVVKVGRERTWWQESLKKWYWTWHWVGCSIIMTWEVVVALVFKGWWDDKCRRDEEEKKKREEEFRLFNEMQEEEFNEMQDEQGENGGNINNNDGKKERRKDDLPDDMKWEDDDNMQIPDPDDMDDKDFMNLDGTNRTVKDKEEEDILAGRAMRGEGREEVFTDRELYDGEED